MYPAHIQVRNRSSSFGQQESVARHAERHALPVAVGALSSRGEREFHPTAILPTQFFSESGRTFTFSSGAQRLMFAVLQDAVACWFRWRDGGTARRRRLFEETHSWFWAPNPSGLYAFERICEVFNLDPGYIRHGLMRWHPSVQEQHAQPALPQSFMSTRRAPVPHTSVLHLPQRESERSMKRRRP